jgi:hypothetical protein
MTVQIDETRSGKINVHENDEPSTLARDFCLTYKLDLTMIPLITQTIE